MERTPIYNIDDNILSASCADIIDEITNDLANLSVQVSSVQHDFNDDDIATSFEASLKALEEQNDKLQTTLEHVLAEKTSLSIISEKKISELRFRNETLVEKLKELDGCNKSLSCINSVLTQKLEALQNTCRCSGGGGGGSSFKAKPFPLDKQIFTTTPTASDSSQKVIACGSSHETGKNLQVTFKEDLYSYQTRIEDLMNELERKNSEISEIRNFLFNREDSLKKKLESLAASKTQTEQQLKDLIVEHDKEIKKMKITEVKLVDDFEKLLSDFNEKSKDVGLSDKRAEHLEKQLRLANRQTILKDKEIDLLKTEMYAIRERYACLDGVSSSIKGQLLATQKELCNYRNTVEKYNDLLTESKELQTNFNRTKDAHLAMIMKYNSIVEDYNNLYNEHRKNVDINKMLNVDLTKYTKWEKEQMEVETIVKSKITELTDRNQALLEERKNMEKKLSEMYFENTLMAHELERLKETNTRLKSFRDLGGGDVTNKHVDGIVQKIMQKTIQLKQSKEQFEDEEIRGTDNF